MNPLDIVTQLGAIEGGNGRETGHATRRPQQLAMLRDIAIVQSVDTSNALEGITAPFERIAALAAQSTRPTNRSEQEIAGYRHALGQIHEHGSDIPFEPRYVQQLHGYLFRLSGARHGGAFKRLDDVVSEVGADGAVTERFNTVSADRTPAAMVELHDAFALANAQGVIPYPLLCGAYILDFLTIHPFTDGNGRMSRLLTLLLLYQGGYGVGRYISLERIVLETGASYYEALHASTKGWHENRHDLLPWIRYFLGVIVAAYRELDDRMQAIGSSSASKRDAVQRAIAELPTDEFTAAEILHEVPGLSRDYLGSVLRRLREQEVIGAVGRGRGARWRRLPEWRRRLEG